MSPKDKEIMALIEKHLDEGMRFKQDIYAMVANELGVPRPSVRRVAGTLKKMLRAKTEILESDITPLQSGRGSDSKWS